MSGVPQPSEYAPPARRGRASTMSAACPPRRVARRHRRHRGRRHPQVPGQFMRGEISGPTAAASTSVVLFTVDYRAPGCSWLQAGRVRGLVLRRVVRPRPPSGRRWRRTQRPGRGRCLRDPAAAATRSGPVAITWAPCWWLQGAIPGAM